MTQDVIANKYRIVREIARSNDVVYEATDATMGRRIALKKLLIPPNLTGDARRERIERFNREARAAGRLSHPNIVTVYDFGEDNGEYFIAMEYLEGQTLRDLIQTRGALPVKEAVDIACQVLAALGHAHANKVIHRDVKPDNINILPGGQIKLTDFGIARLSEEASLTGEGQVFGTPSYMSPEQIVGRAIDPRSDLFSTAIVLYEMLTGRKPFTGDSVVSITYNIMHVDPLPATGVPYGVDQVIQRALKKEPGMRYGSADEMLRALRNADILQPPVNHSIGATSLGGLNGGLGGGMPGGALGGGMNGGYPQAPAPSPYGGGPAAAPAGAGAPMKGPFATWGPGGAVPAGTRMPTSYGAPPPNALPARPPRKPMSEGTRVFLKAMFGAVVAALALLGLLVMFMHAYDQQRTQGAEMVANKLVQDGTAKFNDRDYAGAMHSFLTAMLKSPDSKSGTVARSNLAITYSKLGVAAFERQRLDEASDYFTKVGALFNASDHPATEADKKWVSTAQEYLDRIHEKQNPGEANAFGSSAPSNAGSQAGPSGNQVLNSQEAQAQQLLAAGDRAYANGDRDQAREYWTQAVSMAPGSTASQTAQQRINDASSGVRF